MQNDLHEIQVLILKKLLFHPKLRYSDLRPSEEIENNKLNFHINQLKNLGLVKKSDDLYVLTNKGKEFAGRLDTDILKVQKQAKISAWICPIRDVEGELEFLIYTRLKSPFFGCQGFMSGKVDYGEKILDAAKRELKEECDLEGNPEIVALKHYIVFDKSTNEMVEDKFMFLCIVKNPTGNLFQSEEGKYEWVKKSNLEKYIMNHFESWAAFESQLNLIKNYQGNTQFIEEEHYSEKF
jgi:8-oxo-dGTP pyrophosphatase MutT (NUDIX family)